jgi:PAS domain S-box-containing protein
MDYKNLDKEELIRVIYDLQNANDGLKEFFERDSLLLKQAEKERQRSEEKFRKAFLTSPDSININRLSDGLYVSVNQGFLNMLGYSEGEVLGRTSIDLNIWEDANRRNELVRLLNQNGKAENFEARFRRKDGKIITGLMSASLIDLDGEPHLLNITRDISRLKETEELLNSERNLLRTLIDNMPDRIYAKDLESRFLICNEALVRRMGKKDASEIIGKSDFDLLDGYLAANYYEKEQEIIRTGRSLINHEESMGTVAGKMRWSLTTKVPLRDAAGKIKGIVGIGRDITERRRKENENRVLYEITNGFTNTLNLDELLKLIHSSLCKVVYAENFFVALHNPDTGLFSFPYFVDKYDEIPPPTDLKKSCTSFVFRTVKPFLFTTEKFELLRKSGEVDQVGTPSPSWVGIPLVTPSRVTGVMVLQHYEAENIYTDDDINFLVSIAGQIALAIERKKTEDEIILKNELLELVNAEKDKFLSIIAHDLRGPLSAFVSATRILAEEISNMTIEEVKDIVGSMKNDAASIYTMLENLLEWSRLQRGVIEYNPELIDLSSTVEKVLYSVSAASNAKQIALSTDVEKGIKVFADRHMIETVIRNLVSNSIKFTHAGGEIKVSAGMAEKDQVLIRVRDTGIGMDKKLIDKLFRINEKTNRPGTDGEPSSGLGLLLCNEFIEKNRGSINVESEPGKGSTFIVKLQGELNFDRV